MTMHVREQPLQNPLDTLLAGYAAGVLSAPLHTLVASHLALSPRSRAFVSLLEAAKGRALDALEPVALVNRDETLRAILCDDEAVRAPPRAVPAGEDPTMPRPLARYLGAGIADLPWRTKLPGIREYRLEADDRGGASLYWVRAGRRMPPHGPDGSEVTLVLQGAFREGHGCYERGDIAIADEVV